MIAALSLRLGIACVFLYAAMSKVLDPAAGEGGFERFVRLLQQHGVVPPAWTRAAAIGVLGVEFSIAACFLLPRPPRAIAWLAVATLSGFSLYLIGVGHRQGFVECACFGQVGPTSLVLALLRNVGISAGVLAWVWIDPPSTGLSGGSAGELPRLRD